MHRADSRARRRIQRRRRRRRRLLVASSGVVLLGAIAGGIFLRRSDEPGSRRTVATSDRHPPAEVPAWSSVAIFSRPVSAYNRPTTTAVTSTIPAGWAGQFLSMPVIATVRGWDEVRVVARPSDPPTMWIQSAAAEITRTPYRIVVDLRTTRLLLFRRSQLLVCVPAAVGTADSPTPLGHYFVALLAHSPPGDAGPFIVVTSAVVDGITGWEQSGNAMVTIAGSASASQIGARGARTTTGSVQLPAADERLLRPVPLGSPIDVVTTLPYRLDRHDRRLCDSKTGLPAIRHRHKA